MNAAIVGTGNIAATHAKALRGLGQNLVVVVDKDLEKAQAFAKRWGAGRASAELTEALAPDVEVVHVCTPPALHYQMLKTILQAKKHVISEKPLCLDMQEAKELAALAGETGVLTAVNFNVRYHEACHRAKEAIAAPEFGKPRLISGWYKQEFHVLPTGYSWRYQPGLGGKMRAVTEIGSHWVDLARFWTGLEIEAVSASFGKFDPERVVVDGQMYPKSHGGGEEITVDTEDAAIVTLRFSDGALGTVLLSEVSHGRSNSVLMEVSGGSDSLWWCSENPYCLNHAKARQGVNSMVNAFGGGFPDTFAGFFEDVYATLEKGSTVGGFPSFTDGYINAAVCEAIYQSASQNGIFVPVFPELQP